MSKYIEPVFNIRTGEQTIIERDFTQEEINAKAINSKLQCIDDINTRLEQIDTQVAQARVIEDILNGNPPAQRVLDLLTERKTLVTQLNTL